MPPLPTRHQPLPYPRQALLEEGGARVRTTFRPARQRALIDRSAIQSDSRLPCSLSSSARLLFPVRERAGSGKVPRACAGLRPGWLSLSLSRFRELAWPRVLHPRALGLNPCVWSCRPGFPCVACRECIQLRRPCHLPLVLLVSLAGRKLCLFF